MISPDICFRPTKDAHSSWQKGGRPVVLSPDDILTLKLLRDNYKEYNLGNYRTTESDRVLETLERILKQVV
jgi:hypothetical protein